MRVRSADTIYKKFAQAPPGVHPNAEIPPCLVFVFESVRPCPVPEFLGHLFGRTPGVMAPALTPFHATQVKVVLGFAFVCGGIISLFLQDLLGHCFFGLPSCPLLISFRAVHKPIWAEHLEAGLGRCGRQDQGEQDDTDHGRPQSIPQTLQTVDDPRCRAMHRGHATGFLWGFQIHTPTKVKASITAMPAIMYIASSSFFSRR